MTVARWLEPRTGIAVTVPDYLKDLCSDRRCSPREARGIIYRALVRAANIGAPAPTGWVLATLIGYDTSHSTAAIVGKLESMGMIKVWRGQRERQVTITATRKKTKPCRSARELWRVERKRNAIQPVQAEG